VNPNHRTQAERRATARAALLRATAEIVVESGVPAVTLAAVGERAGYSRGMVTHHFGSKRGLLDALAREAQTGMSPGLEEVPAGLGHLLRLVEDYLTKLGRDPNEWSPFLLLWADAAAGSDVTPVMRERDAWFRDLLRSDVATGVADGTIRADVDPDLIAVRILAELRGFGLLRLVEPAAVDASRVAASVAAAWRHALAPGAPSEPERPPS
jgi:AcrR family transcriptional regulator